MKTSKKSVIVLALFYVALTVATVNTVRRVFPKQPTPISSQSLAVDNLVPNGGFESTQAQCPCAWWDRYGNLYSTTFDNVWCPAGWTPFFYDQIACSGVPSCPLDDPYCRTGKPESRVITRYPDPLRVYEGNQAAMIFTFHRCNFSGFFVKVPATPGQYIQASMRGHVWYSNCSSMPHSTKPRDWIDFGCPVLDWPWHSLKIGVSNVDPLSSPYVIPIVLAESKPAYIYGQYGEIIVSPIVRVTGDYFYIIILSDASHALRHVDAYIDDVRAWIVYRRWLPIVARDATW